MGPGDLKRTLCNLQPENSNILVGFDTSEDASVYKINEDQAIVQTLDFITPVVDDPYLYGQIAAANSLSDVFAMGADVTTALNIVGFDKANLDSSALGEILRGGNDKIKECGGVLLGGHTIESPEMYYGLSVTGMIHPDKILRNNTAKVGNVLVLTKPIGMGILTTAIKRDLLEREDIQYCVDIMRALNYEPSRLLREFDVSSCTDITGFGLLGHALESINENISFELDFNSIPIVEKTFELIEQKVYPGGTARNFKYIEDKVSFRDTLSKQEKLILSDAQTSGGLLVSMPQDQAKEYIKKVEEHTFGLASIIGEVIPKTNKDIKVI